MSTSTSPSVHTAASSMMNLKGDQKMEWETREDKSKPRSKLLWSTVYLNILLGTFTFFYLQASGTVNFLGPLVSAASGCQPDAAFDEQYTIVRLDYAEHEGNSKRLQVEHLNLQNELSALRSQLSHLEGSSSHTANVVNTKLKKTYEGEDSLEWESCGDVSGRVLECSRLQVPMDQYNATNSGNKTFDLPIIRLRGDKTATKNILLNPGGPGGSGHSFVYKFGERLSTIMGTGFHLVSFDPRGVNGSRPAANCYPDAESRKRLSNVRTERRIEDSIEAWAWAHNFGKGCVDTMGEHGQYLNTPQTAADMNTILDRLGQKEMLYWGFSYGTVLGQTYASIFPERSHRVAIDGVVDNIYWFGERFPHGQLPDMGGLDDSDKVLAGFFEECIKAGPACPLEGYGKTPKALQHKVMDYIRSLQEHPLSVYLNNTNWGTLTPESVLYTGLFPATYKPSSWWTVADRLARLLDGNATEAYLAWAGQGPWDSIMVDEANTVIHANDAITGPESYGETREELLEKTSALYNISIFTPSIAKGFYIRQAWGIPKTHSFKQKKHVKTAHPLLVLSTTYDPVCPLSSAKLARSIFEGSQLVELEGYGHCTLNMPSLCVAKHIRAYFYNGTIPDKHIKCPVEGSYFVKPNATSEAVEVIVRDKTQEDREIYQAQLEIAQDESWPYMW